MLDPGRRRVRFPRLATIGWPRGVAIAVLAVAVAAILTIVLAPRSRSVGNDIGDANAAIARGDYSAARLAARAMVAAHPGSPAAHLLLAQTDLLLGDGLAAEAEVQRAADAGASPRRLHGARALARWLEGDDEGAIAAAGQAPPGDTLAIRAMARALADKGEVAAGGRLLVAAHARAPRDAAILTDLARIRLRAGDIGAAAIWATRAAAVGRHDPAALTVQGEVVRQRYGLAAALPWFEAALARDAAYHPALIEYAATLGDLGRHAEMLAATRRALAARPGSPQALYLQAMLAARGGERALARALLKRAGDIERTLPAGMLLDAALDQADGRDEQAIGTWRRLIAIQPMNVRVRRLLAAALLRSRDAAGAVDVLAPMAVREDADGYTLALYARALEVMGDRAEAAAAIDRAQAARRGASAVFGVDGPVAGYAAATMQAPGDPGAAVALIRALLDTGDTGAALTRAQALAAAAPGVAGAQVAAGDAAMLAGRMAAGVDAYRRAADLSFDEPVMLRLVDALGRVGRARDAAATLSLYLRQNPQSIVAQRLRAHWLVASGAGEAAIEPLESIRRIVGNRDVALLADLSSAYAAAGEGAVARRYARAAYALAPMNAAVADAYGVALLAEGDRGAARQLFAKARALDAADPVIAAHWRMVAR